MSEERTRPAGDLAQLARDLHEAREILANVESVALSGVAQSLAQTTQQLLSITKELREQQPQEWLRPNVAAAHLGMSRSSLDNSDCPRSHLTPQVVRYNTRKMDEWAMSK